MRTLPTAVAAHLAARQGLLIHALTWLSARDRTTGATETIGLWTGADHQNVVIAGAARRYHGVGAILGLEPLVVDADVGYRDWSLQVSSLHAQVIEALRIYDARLAPVEMHLWYFDSLTHNPLADPIREFRGTVMELDLPTPPVGGEATARIACVSDAWRLTRGLSLKRSDAALRARTGGLDGLRRHNATPTAVTTAWGEWIKETAPAAPAAAAAASTVTDERMMWGGDSHR